MSTYTERHKAYYEKNKKLILSRTKEARKRYNRDYYQAHKAEWEVRRALRRKRQRLRQLRESIYNQEPPS